MPTMPERNDATPSPVADLVARVGRVEADVSQLKADVAEIKATLPHLATKADLAPIQALLPHFATKADLGGIETHLAGVRADLAGMESRLVRWMVGSWIAMAGVMTAVMTALVRFAR